MLTDTLIDIIVPSDITTNYTPTTTEQSQKDDTPILTQVRSILKTNYYHSQDVSDDKKLERDAIRGVVDGLGDPYSDFCDKACSNSFSSFSKCESSSFLNGDREVKFGFDSQVISGLGNLDSFW